MTGTKKDLIIQTSSPAKKPAQPGPKLIVVQNKAKCVFSFFFFFFTKNGSQLSLGCSTVPLHKESNVFTVPKLIQISQQLQVGVTLPLWKRLSTGSQHMQKVSCMSMRWTSKVCSKREHCSVTAFFSCCQTKGEIKVWIVEDCRLHQILNMKSCEKERSSIPTS